jgi:FkbM family methyltransferase
MTAAFDPTLLYVHGVGSRGESLPLPVDRRYGADMVCCNYEPDAEALEQTSGYFDGLGLSERTFPVAVDGRPGQVDIHINYDPFTSSILEPNPAYARFYGRYPLPNADYPMGVACRPVRKLRVEAVRLDQWCARSGVGLDYVSLDTQGNELDILEGAGDLVRSDLLAMMVEAEFHPLYRDQRLFEEMLAFTRRNGFHILRLMHHPPGSFFRGPLGWRGTGITVSSDILFFKDPAAILAEHAAPRRSLLKLAFIALCWDNIEYALDCLEATERACGAADDEAVERRGYAVFLRRFQALYREETAIFPPTFADLFSEEESFARFNPGGRADGYDVNVVRRRYFARVDMDDFARAFPPLLETEPTAVERLLLEGGFPSAVEFARANRLRGAAMTAHALGLADHGVEPTAAGVRAALAALRAAPEGGR